MLGMPDIIDIFEAEFGGVPIVVYMVVVLVITRYVHVSSIPIPAFGLALGAPMGPDAELGILEPLGALVIFP
jgi:hypothetical protein